VLSQKITSGFSFHSQKYPNFNNELQSHPINDPLCDEEQGRELFAKVLHTYYFGSLGQAACKIQAMERHIVQ
jgi:hypothetical protein